MRVKARIQLKRTREKNFFPPSLLASRTPVFSRWFMEHVCPCSLRSSLAGPPFPKPTNLVFKIVFKFMRGTIPCATPSHRIAVCYWRNWGSVVCLPSLSFKRFFCLHLSFPSGDIAFRPFDDLISRCRRVLLRFWPRRELKNGNRILPSIFWIYC